MASPSTAAVVQPLNIDMGDTMTLTPVEVETARQAREEKLLGFDYMPAFLCPKPVQYEKYWSPEAGGGDCSTEEFLKLIGWDDLGLDDEPPLAPAAPPPPRHKTRGKKPR